MLVYVKCLNTLLNGANASAAWSITVDEKALPASTYSSNQEFGHTLPYILNEWMCPNF